MKHRQLKKNLTRAAYALATRLRVTGEGLEGITPGHYTYQTITLIARHTRAFHQLWTRKGYAYAVRYTMRGERAAYEAQRGGVTLAAVLATLAGAAIGLALNWLALGRAI